MFRTIAFPITCIFVIVFCVVNSPFAHSKTPPAIREITVEQGCFGCPTGSIFTIRSDRSVTYTQTGNARHGTSDVTRNGWITRLEFQSITRQLEAAHFFDLKDEYGDPEQQDGPWTTITVRFASQSKAVTDRNGNAPPKLEEALQAIASIRKRFVVSSGSVKR